MKNKHGVGVEQGWPHFLCNGQKKYPQELSGHKNMSKKAWRAKFNLKQSYLIDILTFYSPLSTKNASYQSNALPASMIL